MWAVLLAPLGAYLLYLPGRWATRWLWRRMPDGRLKRILFSKPKGFDYPPGAKRWDE